MRLNAVPHFSPDKIRRLLAVRSAEQALACPVEELALLLEVSAASARRFRETALAFDALDDLETADRIGARVICWGDPDYPQPLVHGPDAPLLLYALGSLTPEPAALACVGSRRPTPYGRRMARRLAGDAAAAGLVIVSGLARGIDGQAHEAALDRGGRTWAVLGSGLAEVYPPEHEALARRIVESGGCLLSEVPLKAAPIPSNFPRRNRIVAGLCWATVVVEGRMRSGSLITARLALDLGRELFAVPGPADSPLSEAPHELLRLGAAAPACSAQDIFQALPPGCRLSSATQRPGAGVSRPSLSSEYRKILELIGADSRTLDDLIQQSGLGVSRLSHLLFEMELQGLVSPVPGQRYAKKAN